MTVSTGAPSRLWPPAAAAQWEAPERALVEQLNPQKLPRHVAIIMDGNGRWARQRGFADRIRGHEAGIKSVRTATRTSAELGLEVLTLYAFSTENWQRPALEVRALMALLQRFLVGERPELMENNIRLSTIGDTANLPEGARRALNESIELTAGNTGLTLNLALSYSGRDELARAVRELAAEAAAGMLKPEAIDASVISARLDTAVLPDPDLLVRTSGEMRISNFMLWQIAYAEIVVTPVLWPDFRRLHFLEALLEYGRRERRFGRVPGAAPSGA